MTISKNLLLPKDKYYEVHLSLVNALLPTIRKLTPKEIEILSLFMGLEGDISNDRFGTSAKKIIKEKLNLSDGGLGNHMKSMKQKGCIGLRDGIIIINPLLQCSPTEQSYTFKLKKDFQ